MVRVNSLITFFYRGQNIIFINPIKDSYITSVFGYRTHPVTGAKQSFHQGVDLALQPNTNVKVVASAGGEVIRVGALGTYGNVVMIAHIIDGKRYDTNYAHLKDKSIVVKVGQKVKQGDVLGIMGSTGSSTAPHLHFEIHHGQWKTGQPNAVNPANFIKFYAKGVVQPKEAKKEVIQVVKVNNEIPSSWAKDAVEWAKKTKPVAVSDGTRLKENVTREESITMIYRAIHNK